MGETDLLQSFLDGLAQPESESAAPVSTDAASPGPAVPDRAALRSELERVLSEAAQSWPDVPLPPARVARYVARRVPADSDALAAVQRMRVADLHLACGCAAGDARAITRLEAQCFGSVEAALARMRYPREAVADIKQALREQLFVAGPDGREPGIVGYSGTGRLCGWVRIVAVRTAGRMAGREGREVPLEDGALQDLLPGGEDLEQRYLRETYRSELKQAVARGLEHLSSRDRVVLRYHFVDRLSIDKIGRIYRVHRSTAARWIERARQRLMTATQEALMQHLELSHAGYDSVVRLVQGQLDLTITRILQ